MYFQLKSWASIASTDKSHSLIFEPYDSPIYIMSDDRHQSQDDYFLKKFLKLCDVSGARMEFNRQQYKKSIEADIKKKQYHQLRRQIFGKNFKDRDTNSYIKKNDLELALLEYPLTHKPVIKTINTEGFRFIFNADLSVYEIEGDEQKIMDAAKECDILLIRDENGKRQRYCVMNSRLNINTTMFQGTKGAINIANFSKQLDKEETKWHQSITSKKRSEFEFISCYRI